MSIKLVQNLFVLRQSMLLDKDFYTAKCFHPEQHQYKILLCDRKE